MGCVDAEDGDGYGASISDESRDDTVIFSMLILLRFYRTYKSILY